MPSGTCLHLQNAGEPDLQKEADELRKQLMKELLEIQREPTKRVLEPGLANKWLKIPPDEVKTVFW